MPSVLTRFNVAEARRLILGGGVYINNIRVKAVDYVIESDVFIDTGFVPIRTGKRNSHLHNLSKRFLIGSYTQHSILLAPIPV